MSYPFRRRLTFLVAAAMWVLLDPVTATPVQAQFRGAEVIAGINQFLFAPHERWPAVGGRVRFGADGSPLLGGVTVTMAFDPIFGGTWTEFGGTLLVEPALFRRVLQFGAGYSGVHADFAAGSGLGHGVHGLSAIRFGANARRYVGLEARGLIGPSRRRADTSREPVRTFTVVLVMGWRR